MGDPQSVPERVTPRPSPLAAGPALLANDRKAIATVLPTALDFVPPERSFADERLYRKQRLAASLRLFARMGFAVGASGHISARDPEFPDCFWVNPGVMHFSRVRVSDLMLVSERGEVIHGEGPANAAAVAIHLALHAARPDVVSAAHSHSLHGKTWSAMHEPLEPLCQDSAAFYQDHTIFHEYTGVVNERGEGDMIADALSSAHAVILANHGLLTVGACVESAVWRYLAFDNACHVQLLARQAGAARPMPHDVAVRTQRLGGSEMAGRYSFEPYWQMLLAQEPDFLD